MNSDLEQMPSSGKRRLEGVKMLKKQCFLADLYISD